MTTFIPELNEEMLATGYIWATKLDEKGPQRGLMPISDVADIMRALINYEAAGRTVKMISRFSDSPFLSWGQNGPKWLAVKVIEPADYYLVSSSGTAYPVRLPRLIAWVGNHDKPYLWWVKDGELTLETPCYPLMVGNIDSRGWVCMGTSTLMCKGPEQIDEFIRQVVEVPATGTYLTKPDQMDKLFAQLAKGWAPGIGRLFAIPLSKVLAKVGG